MTKKEIIGQVILRLSGGRPNTDMSVRRGEIASLIAPCVNYLYTQQYYLEKREEDGDKSVNPLMLQTYDDVVVKHDSRRDRKYADLPATPITLPSGRSVDFVGSLQGKGFIPISNQDVDLEEHYACYKRSVTSYLLEGEKLWFWNINPLVKEIMVKMIVSVDSLGDDDEVKIPSNSGPQLITMLFELLTGQRQLPSDPINDGQDHS